MARDAPGDLDRAQPLLVRAQSEAASSGYAVVERRATAALANLDGS